MLSAAAKMGGGKAQPALQLVGYEEEVEAAVKYAFGNAFVCQVRAIALDRLCSTAPIHDQNDPTTIKLLVDEMKHVDG